MAMNSNVVNRASEVAQAINDMVHFCDKDQEALLHVIEDYIEVEFRMKIKMVSECLIGKKKSIIFFNFVDSSEDEGMIESSNLDVSHNATNAEPIGSESFIEEMENEAEVWNDEENEVQDEESGLESEELVHHALSYVP